MSTMRGWFTHFEEMAPDFGVSVVKGTSMTVPGQGSDLMTIIQSIVKLPPLDERTFDVGAGEEVDTDRLAIQSDIEGLYPAEGKNYAEDAKVRQEARKASKQAIEAPDKDADDKDKDAK